MSDLGGPFVHPYGGIVIYLLVVAALLVSSFNFFIFYEFTNFTNIQTLKLTNFRNIQILNFTNFTIIQIPISKFQNFRKSRIIHRLVWSYLSLSRPL